MGKSEELIQAELLRPFKASDVEWRLQWTDKEKSQGLAVPFIDNRAIQARLDTTVGIFGWRNEFTEWQGESSSKKAQLCTIYIYSEARSEWIGKSDGADNSDIEPVKGGLSDSMKRAAVEWGIGRFLYEFDAQWVRAKPRSSSFVVHEDDRPKLDGYYNDMVAKLTKEGWFNVGKVPTSTPAAGKEPDTTSQPPTSGKDKVPDNVTPQKKTSSATRLYKVIALTEQDTLMGKQAHLKIENDRGESVDVFLKNADPKLSVGCTLTQICMEKTENKGMVYCDLTQYTIVETPLAGAA